MTTTTNAVAPDRLHDVLVAGAGPVGLLLACELALAGVDVLVLERAESADAPLKRPPLGTRGLSVATAEAFDRRGLLATLHAAVGFDPSRPAQVGHFAGIDVDPALVASHPALTNFAADIASIEAVLAARAAALGVELRRGCAVDALDDRGDEIVVHAGGAAIRARWLVGCDGGRSAVRTLAGFEFPGTEPAFTAYSALVDIANPDALAPGRHETAHGFALNESGRIAIADFDDGAFDRSRTITRDHLQAVLRRVSGTDVALSAVHQALSFTDRARLATTYRRGRVLLAGDAAHIHSALGGQGLNAGLGDAMNLGWKLAATVRGTAPDGLLDTYETERRPVGQWLMDWTRAQTAALRPGPHGDALRGVLGALIATRDGATWFAEQLWGVALRVDVGDGHPLAGRSSPDVALADGTRLAERLREGRGVLVDFADAPALRAAIAPWADRIALVRAAAGRPAGLAAMLVRPDGVVAWASDEPPSDAAPHAAATRWFGDPRPPVSSGPPIRWTGTPAPRR